MKTKILFILSILFFIVIGIFVSLFRPLHRKPIVDVNDPRLLIASETHGGVLKCFEENLARFYPPLFIETIKPGGGLHSHYFVRDIAATDAAKISKSLRHFYSNFSKGSAQRFSSVDPVADFLPQDPGKWLFKIKGVETDAEIQCYVINVGDLANLLLVVSEDVK